MTYANLTEEEKKQLDFDYVMRNIKGSYTSFHFDCSNAMIELYKLKYPECLLVDDLELEFTKMTKPVLIPKIENGCY